MIKGINKQILEVTATDSPYFEKIIFFVRPSSQSIGEKLLKSEAEKLALQAKPAKSRKSFKQISSAIIFSLIGIGAGAALVYLGGVL